MKKVKLSVNAPLSAIDVLERCGYDLIEPSNTDIAAMTGEEFAAAASALKSSALRCEVIDNPIPCSVSFSSDGWSLEEWDGYLKLSAGRAAALGARYWCFGNGSSRVLPGSEEGDRRVKENFRAAVEKCADIAACCGFSVIVEPLGPSVTNYLLTVGETAEFVRSLGRRNVFTMVDYRWEYEQDRPVSELYENARLIAHAHIDNPDTDYKNTKARKIQTLQDGFDYGEFLDFIKSEDYHGALSIEANAFEDFEREAAGAIDFYAHYGIEPARKGEA